MQVPDAAGAEVLGHQQQRLMPYLCLIADRLLELQRPALPLLAAGTAQEEIAEEGATREEHAPGHVQVQRARSHHARVG